MEKQKWKQLLPRYMLILAFVSISVYLYGFSSPEQLINVIGVENAYLLMFILSFVGGLSTFTGIPYHLVLITLATGGLNPWLLGTATALGVMAGDTTSYFVGYQGGDIIPKPLQKILTMVRNFGTRHPTILPVFFFLYGCLSPFSNDFIVISMGLSRYPYWRVMIPLGMGNLVFNISLAYFATQAYDLLQGIFF